MEQNNRRVKQNLAEHPWGTLKRQRGFDYVLTRGKKKVLGEVGLVFIGYNLSRLEKIEGGINALKEFIMQMMALLYPKRACLKTI
ncbi:hypothetical protein FHX64_000404 [Microbacter margulisiae]|uniref:Transposase DDE domain-containing protein n=2 Tax=Microbacter margulisiae TaxID=1350067 RepID=A0A7W5DNX6_9PORP|nr:hypothetical protein [Microbacter margulisiae]